MLASKRPEGPMRKLLAPSEVLIKAGWKPTVSLLKGIKITYDWYVKEKNKMNIGEKILIPIEFELESIMTDSCGLFFNIKSISKIPSCRVYHPYEIIRLTLNEQQFKEYMEKK